MPYKAKVNHWLEQKATETDFSGISGDRFVVVQLKQS